MTIFAVQVLVLVSSTRSVTSFIVAAFSSGWPAGVSLTQNEPKNETRVSTNGVHRLRRYKGRPPARFASALSIVCLFVQPRICDKCLASKNLSCTGCEGLTGDEMFLRGSSSQAGVLDS